MSESWRPWTDAENVFEAIYQHFKAEIARVEALVGAGTTPAPAPVIEPPPPAPAQPAVVDTIDGQTLVTEGTDPPPAA